MSCYRTLRWLASLGGVLLPRLVWAQGIEINPCFLEGLPCISTFGGIGTEGLANFADAIVLTGLRIVFLAMAIAFFFYYAVRLILESSDENTITETKSAYGYAIGGTAIVSLVSYIVGAFNPPSAGGITPVIEPSQISEGLGLVILFFRLIVSIAVTTTIVFLGVRLILLQGNESEIEQQKKRFFNGLLGVAIVLIADYIIGAFVPTSFGGSGVESLALQIVGIVNFLLTLFGGLALLGFIVAGLMLVISTDETLRDRAKKAIFTTIIAMAIVLCSYIIVHFMITLAA